MALRRGFKSEANNTAKDIRAELSIKPTEPLDPLNLADYLGIPVIGLSTIAQVAYDAHRHFTRREPSAFSAVTVFRGNARTIIHNDAHTEGRQASNLTHELSHALLLHEPTPALNDSGCRLWDPTIEEEADFLSGAILVPEEAALFIVRQGMSVIDAAKYYGTSKKMMDYRLRITNARVRVERSRKYNKYY